jgi:hypothetical protein
LFISNIKKQKPKHRSLYDEFFLKIDSLYNFKKKLKKNIFDLLISLLKSNIVENKTNFFHLNQHYLKIKMKK